MMSNSTLPLGFLHSLRPTASLCDAVGFYFYSPGVRPQSEVFESFFTPNTCKCQAKNLSLHPNSSIIAIITQLTVSIEDVSMLDQIKQAISLLRGVSSVTLKRRRKTSMDRAIEDIEQGRVYKYDSLDDLIKEIEG